MIELNLATREAVVLDGALSFLEILLSPTVPIEIKIKMIGKTELIEVENIHEKLKAELDNLLQAQNMASSALTADPIDLVKFPTTEIDFR